MYELIITEKPNASKRIAEALAEGKPIREGKDGVYFYKISRGKQDIVVACAVGHLYGLAQKEGKKWSFPVFDIEWKPTCETNKSSAFTRKYLNTIKKLAKEAKEFTVATDYDIEGEVIGLNVVRYACKQKDANRMKFSTLTKDELIEAYESKSKKLDWGQAQAGETRHFLDWFNGINYSRALTSSIKKAGSFKLMSTGRVQGPALKIIVDREKEIQKFKPVPFWQIELKGEMKKEAVEAWHKQDKFWDRKEASQVMKNVKGAKKGVISKVERREFKQAPPTPFDLTAMQVEAYRCLGIQPKETLSIAQELYTAGYISYPRTSSNQLPPQIGYKKVLNKIAKQEKYAGLCKGILSKKSLMPNNGKKSDPAHPAIYPTGNTPNLDEREARVYDLVVKRFLATFADAALRETMTVDIDVNKEIFVAKGTRTVEKGWHEYYAPYVKLEELTLPNVAEGDEVKVKKITLHDKETQPPKRYTPASIIKDLEKKGLGTKATRSEIVETLFRRGYVDGKTIEATKLGIRTIDTLAKHSPKIIDEELTRHFESEMDRIRGGEVKSEKVLSDARDALGKIINDFKKNELKIGKELLAANIETRDELNFLGKCVKCKKGDLQMRRGKFGQFAACNKYPKCKTTYSLPNNALIKPAKKVCEQCGLPIVLAIKKAKRPQEFCLNPDCPSKQLEGEALKEAKKFEAGKVEKPCPTCKDGKLLLRSSVYGKFYGCDKFPKCKYTEKLVEVPVKEEVEGKGESNKNT